MKQLKCLAESLLGTRLSTGGVAEGMTSLLLASLRVHCASVRDYRMYSISTPDSVARLLHSSLYP